MRWNQQKEVSEYPWSEYTTRAIIVYPQGAQPDEDGTGRGSRWSAWARPWSTR